jgi:hypothetical protein
MSDNVNITHLKIEVRIDHKKINKYFAKLNKAKSRRNKILETILGRTTIGGRAGKKGSKKGKKKNK